MRTWALVAALLASTGQVGHAQDGKSVPRRRRVIERVAAVVNDTVILESEVAQRAAPMMASNEERPEDTRSRQVVWRETLRKATDQMIGEELVIQAARDAQLEVTDEEVDRAIAEVKKQNKMSDAQFAEALRQQGFAMDNYRRDVRKQILRLRAMSTLVRQRVQVSDDEVKARYERMSGQAQNVTQVTVRHILIALPERPNPQQMESARRKAGELVQRVRGGEDFASLVPTSDDEATRDAGGELGTFSRGELPTEWEEVLFAMEQGEVRGPLRGPRGLHVFQVTESKREEVRPFDEVKDQLREQLTSDEMEKQTKVWMEELRRKAHVEVRL